MTEINSEIEWNDRLEQFFAGTGEKAHALSWIHKKSEERYNRLKNFIDLPVIVGSGVIAFLNAGSSSLFDDPKISSIALGVGSLLVGIANTMGTYFGWSKRAEGHRIAHLQYAKFYRFLNVQMSIPRCDRMTPSELLKYTKDHYDRMAETSPALPAEVIATFQKRFDKPEYAKLSKPEEANGLEHIDVYVEDKPRNEDTPRASSTEVGIAERYATIIRGTGGFNRPSLGGTSRSLQSRSGSVVVQPKERETTEGLQQEPRHQEVSEVSTSPERAVGNGEGLFIHKQGQDSTDSRRRYSS